MSIYGLWESEVFKKKQTVIITPIFCLWRQGSERNLTTLMFSVLCLIFNKNLLVEAFLSVFGLDATVRYASTYSHLFKWVFFQGFFFAILNWSHSYCSNSNTDITAYCLTLLNFSKNGHTSGVSTRNSKSVTFFFLWKDIMLISLKQ